MATDLITKLEEAGEGSREPTAAEVIAELRAATIAITMFGLDKLPEVLRASEEKQS